MHEFVNAESLSIAGLGNVLTTGLSKVLTALKSWFSSENMFTKYLSGLQQVFDAAFNNIRAKMEQNPLMAIGFILLAIVLAAVLGPSLAGKALASTFKGIGNAIGGLFGGVRRGIRGAIRA